MAESFKHPCQVAGLDCTGTVRSSGQRASWNESQKTFLLQQLQKFPRAQRGGWSRDTWMIVVKAMKQAFPDSDFTAQQLKQLEHDLQKLYRHITQILMRPGFKWDNKNCRLHASSECWQQLIETNGRLSWFQRRIPYYDALVVLYKGKLKPIFKENPLQGAGETNSTSTQISNDNACSLFDGFCANMSLPKANEMAPSSSPNFWGSDDFRLNHSHDHDMSFPSIPLSPLLTSDPNPQNKYDYNMIANSNLSEISLETFQTKTTEEAAEFPEKLASCISEGVTTQSNQIPHHFPVQSSNFQPLHIDVSSLNHCHHKISAINNIDVGDNPSFSAQERPDQFSNPQQIITTTTSLDKLAVFPASNGLMNNLDGSSTLLSPNISPCDLPSLNHRENRSLSNNNSDMGRHLSLSAPLSPDRASNSQHPEKQDSFSKENPIMKIRRKANRKRKHAAKSDFSVMRCIQMFEKLPGFKQCDIIHIVKIFRDEFYREAFVAMKRSHKKIWIRSMIDKEKEIKGLKGTIKGKVRKKEGARGNNIN